MFAGRNFLVGAAVALLSVGHASGQDCVSESSVTWYPCGSSTPSCDDAILHIFINWEEDCVANDPIVTVNFAGPIVTRADGWGTLWADPTGYGFRGDVADDKMSVTFGENLFFLYDYYSENEGNNNKWELVLYLDNCDTAYTWSDNFVELSYVDNEQNTIDLSGFENPEISGAEDTGECDDVDLSFSFDFDLF